MMISSCSAAAAASPTAPSVVVLGEIGDNPLAFWEEIQWDFDEYENDIINSSSISSSGSRCSCSCSSDGYDDSAAAAAAVAHNEDDDDHDDDDDDEDKYGRIHNVDDDYNNKTVHHRLCPYFNQKQQQQQQQHKNKNAANDNRNNKTDLHAAAAAAADDDDDEIATYDRPAITTTSSSSSSSSSLKVPIGIRSKQERFIRLAPFELEIERDPYSVTLWVLYLDALKAASSMDRFMIYERALKVLPRSYKLWFRYMKERMSVLVDVSPIHYGPTNNTFERCLVHMSQMPRLWILYLEFLQQQPVITRTRRCFNRALQSLPITQHDRIWNLLIPWVDRLDIPAVAVVIYRRYLMLEPSKVYSYVELLKRLGRYDEAAVTLAKTLDEEAVYVEGRTSHQLWLDLCELVSQHPQSITTLNVEAVLKSGLKRFTDQIGKLWCLLADHFVLLGQTEKARDVFEEALATVSTAHDFGIVFDNYAKFLELLVTNLIQNEENNTSSNSGDSCASKVEVDLILARIEDLVNRRPILLSSVKLRQNPHNIVEWLNRAQLFSNDPIKVIRCFMEAVSTVDPFQSIGKVTYVWIKFAHYYELHEDLENARSVYERATKSRFKRMEDLAGIWCAWAEMELKHKNYKMALEVARRSISGKQQPQALPTAAGVTSQMSEESNQQQQGFYQKNLHRSGRLWSLCADLEECFGTFTTLKACYDKMFDLKVVTPSQALTYTAYLEEKKYWEESFRVYERAVAIFRWPHVYDVWMMYLAKFVARYGGRKLERARELFEQAVVDCPPNLAKSLYLMYGKLEEEYGLARHAIKIYDRGSKVLEDPEELYQFYLLIVAKATEFFGVTRSRAIFEAGIDRLSASDKSAQLAVKLSESFAEIEQGLGETDRARAILKHASQFCDPRKAVDFWKKWREFEVSHGSEETFKDMLRAKRSVQALYAEATVKELCEMVEASRKSGNAVITGEPQTAMEALEAQLDLQQQQQ